MINSEQIQALKAAAEKATPGEWVVEFDDEVYSTDGVNSQQIAMVFSEHGYIDATLIAAANPAVILSLLAERDADKALIAELQEKQRETLRQARSFREAHDSASEIIRRHESRTIHLELPTTRLWAGTVDCYETKEILMAIRAACAAAGITLVVGE